MKKFMRPAIILAAAAMLSAALPGCTSTNTSPSSSPSTTGGSSTSAPSTAQQADNPTSQGENSASSPKASPEPITIRVFTGDRADAPISADLPVLKEFQTRTNVFFELDIAPTTGTAEKFNLMMASGDLPDMVMYDIVNILQYADKGAFTPLDDMLEENAPTFTKLLNDNPDYRKALVANDGKIYTFPQIAGIRNEFTYCIRKDWLDKLGLEVPTTLDEFTEVLTAFRDKDPNGNGQQDEIPFTFRSGYTTLGLFEQFGIFDDFFIEDGKVKYDAIDPRMKDYLEYASMLYREKLVDPEYVTMDNQLWENRMTNSVSGVTYDWNTRIDIFNTSLQKEDPNAQLIGMLPPMGPSGKVQTRRQMKAIRGGGSAISSTSKYKKEIIKMYDYVYTEEGSELMNFGILGEHYTKDNGGLKYTDFVTNNPDGKSPQVTLFSIGIDRMNYLQRADYEDAFVSDEVRQTRQMYNPIIIDPYPPLKFTDEEQKEINKKMTEIDTYRDEMMDKFIMGAESLDQFDAFVEKLKAIGIEDVIAIHEASLERYQNS